MSNMSNESSLSSHSIPQIKTFTTDRGRVAAFLAGVLSSRVGVAPGSILFFFFFFPLLLTICCLSLHYECRDMSLTKVEASCVKRSSQCWQILFLKVPALSVSLCVLTVSHEPRRSSTTAFILVSTETEHGGDNDRGS